MSKILVTVDFTPTAEKAIALAGNIAKTRGDEIVLLHIFEAMHMGEKAAQAMKFSPIYKALVNDLEDLCEKTRNVYGIKVSFIIKDGDIFEHISQSAKEINCSLVVMGVHGLKGIQKITGSYAAQIIAQCTHPFLTIQQNGMPELSGNMLVYTNERTITADKQKWISDFASKFALNVVLIVSTQAGSHMASIMNQNREEFKTLLNNANVSCELSEADNADEVLAAAGSHKPSIIVLIKETSETEFTEDEIKLLYNSSQIPLMRL